MEKELANKKLQEIKQKIFQIESFRHKEIIEENERRYLPLIEQAKQLKIQIELDVFAKYKGEIDALNQELENIKPIVNQYTIQDAKDLWYKEGTIVWLWEREGSMWSSNRTIKKTNKNGTVVIYDGTQNLANVPSYSMPSIGDVIVIINKKDGTLGLKFETITKYGEVKNYTSHWYCDGDTPTNNIKTRKQAIENLEISDK